MRIVRRRVTFSEQLPDTLQLVASALRAGFSLAQAVDAVVREDAQPIAGEFSRAMGEVRLGGNLEDGLDAVANRMDSDDLRWTVTAIRIQQGVGGNLAEILLTIAGTIRERAFLRRQVRALSAEGRLSAYVLIALPVLIGIWLFVSAPQYMSTLYTTSIGKLALGAATVLVVLGAFWMRKMIKIKI
jgi:Flp pilus assembly protein TadB